MTVCICPDAGKDGHVWNCPTRVRLLPEVNSDETWSYKNRRYIVVRVRPDIRIQFNNNWDTSVFYRLSSPEDADEAALKFVRSQTDFLDKFRKV